MANSIVGYTKDTLPQKVVYTGCETDSSITIIDNNPSSPTYSQVGVEVKEEVLGNKIAAADESIDIIPGESTWRKVKVNISADPLNLISLEEDGLNVALDVQKLASKEWVEDQDYLVDEDLQELRQTVQKKQDALIPGIGISIEDNVISASELDQRVTASEANINTLTETTTQQAASIAALAQQVSTVEQELDSGLDQKQDLLTAGSGIAINKVGADTIISTLDAPLGTSFVTTVPVGGIPVGTSFTASTKLSTILEQMLTGGVPVVETTIYHGITNTIPSTVEEIESLVLDSTKSKAVLLQDGYNAAQLNPVNQFVVFAIDKEANLKVDQILVSGFSISFNELEIGNYFVYVEENPVTLSDITYSYIFKEV